MCQLQIALSLSLSILIAFTLSLQDNKEGLELLKVAIEKAGYTGRIEIGMDCAASEFYKDGKYDLNFKSPDSDPSKWLTSKRERDGVCVCVCV